MHQRDYNLFMWHISKNVKAPNRKEKKRLTIGLGRTSLVIGGSSCSILKGLVVMIPWMNIQETARISSECMVKGLFFSDRLAEHTRPPSVFLPSPRLLPLFCRPKRESRRLCLLHFTHSLEASATDANFQNKSECGKGIVTQLISHFWVTGQEYWQGNSTFNISTSGTS